eukprot:CAMPEP_0183547904 /NCGR_PEP_ID=MMETSP0371-20130417/57675_1 /TAXON_ID=268820 /ORGANISM="Peridinium aciculiferum, Strain PAER-2" /LENGTH=98 /DNA_ID=CAMNT_0025751023 /DNA_START=103 /DNA_END=396 /DNA_ORIENTATION=+
MLPQPAPLWGRHLHSRKEALFVGPLTPTSSFQLTLKRSPTSSDCQAMHSDRCNLQKGASIRHTARHRELETIPIADGAHAVDKGQALKLHMQQHRVEE